MSVGQGGPSRWPDNTYRSGPSQGSHNRRDAREHNGPCMIRTPWTDSTRWVAPDITAGMALRASGFIPPCLPIKAEIPPSGPGWVYEIKHDGFRMMVRRDPAGVRLLTRNGHDWSDRYPLIAAAVGALRVRSCLIDGEQSPAVMTGCRASTACATGARTAPCSCSPLTCLSSMAWIWLKIAGYGGAFGHSNRL